jgi:hypothetical protein
MLFKIALMLQNSQKAMLAEEDYLIELPSLCLPHTLFLACIQNPYKNGNNLNIAFVQ